MDDDVDRWLAVAAELLDQPTAPLHEAGPAALVRSRGAAAGLHVHGDPAGNVVLRHHPPGADGERPLVLVAHLDHPGFVVEMVNGAVVELSFHGGLPAVHGAPGALIELFTVGNAAPAATVRLVSAIADDAGRLTGAHAEAIDGAPVVGGFGMWAFPGWSVDDGRITARACDDLLGAAAALCALEELATGPPGEVAVWGLFTRAEEIGFLGALEAIRHQVVPTGASVVSLECSKALPGAAQGGGVIVRVGDRMSVFDPGLTAALAGAAADVAVSDPSFRWQRRLMDGGACEATAFCASGYRASGLALPLGNYHNAAFADDGSPSVGPEHVLVDDFSAMVRLLVALARRPEHLVPANGRPPAWLVERAAQARAALGDG